MEGTSLSAESISTLISARKDFVRFVRGKVESDAVAEDIVQNAFVKGIESAHTPGEEKIISWFYTVLRNAVIDHYRRRAAATRAMDRFEEESGITALPDEEDRKEICKCLNGILETLKPEYREALNIVDLQDMSLEELASAADISVANAGVRIHRARKALLKQLHVTCNICAEHGCLDCSCESSTCSA